MQQRIDFLLEAGLSRDDLAKAVTSHTQVPPPLPAYMLSTCSFRVASCCSGDRYDSEAGGRFTRPTLPRKVVASNGQ